MRARHGFASFLGPDIEQFIAHKRSAGRRFEVEEKSLRLLDDFLLERHVCALDAVTPALIDEFLASRPRSRPRSYNHLRCTIGRLFAYLVGHGKVARNPLQSPPRRARYQRSPFIFDQAAARTRNQRRAALSTFFSYLAVRAPEMLAVCQQTASIPVKRTPLPDTHYLEREEMTALLRSMPRQGPFAMRDRTLSLFLYNTGARVQEVVDLRVEHLEFSAPSKVRLHGKGDKWRLCPLWAETVKYLEQLLAQRNHDAASPVFCSRRNRPLTRFGVYKIIRRHAAAWDIPGPQPRRVSPHLFRHTAATHLLESGVEVNVIRGWLGHVSLDTTNLTLS